MRYIFLMGGSGTGKTTIAKRLEELRPDTYSRSRELASREIREGEIDGYDYIFITPEQFESEKNFLFEKVEYQFKDKYGCRYENLFSDKWNVVIVCIEAFISAVRNLKPEDSAVLVNLITDTPFVKRDGRDSSAEERFNKAIIYNFINGENNLLINGRSIRYFEIDPVELTDDDKLLDTMGRIQDSVPLFTKIKNAASVDELVSIFMQYSSLIGMSDTLMMAVNNTAEKLSSTLGEICSIATRRKTSEK